MKITIETNENPVLTSEQSDALDKLLEEIDKQNTGIRRTTDKGRLFITEEQFDRFMNIRDKS
ncbi:hypothetical protein GWN91_06660 [Candidatus Saccharibacteria bacterium]|nr:hypothetical protein [Candidatus Saccharibacteria bacterium]NIV72747.1 hypothetical protein [Calditrichia bacterium]NIW80288.1 hypothetical protein [Calditrichia bacterium]